MEIYHHIDAIRGNRRGNPVMTLCMIKQNNTVGCGLSACDPRDKFDEDVGKELARRRALRAVKGRAPHEFKNPDFKETLMEAGIPVLITEKSFELPVITKARINELTTFAEQMIGR